MKNTLAILAPFLRKFRSFISPKGIFPEQIHPSCQLHMGIVGLTNVLATWPRYTQFMPRFTCTTLLELGHTAWSIILIGIQLKVLCKSTLFLLGWL